MDTGWARDADGSWYLASQSGALVTGWQKVGGTWYRIDPSSYEMATGVKDLYEWLAYYDTTYQPLWGWYDGVPLC